MAAPGPQTLARRTVLAGLGALGAAVVLPGPAGALAAPARRPAPATRRPVSPPPAPGLRRRDWTGMTGRPVTVATPSGRIRMTVTEVADIAGAAPGHDRCFTVLLRAPRRGGPGAGIHTVTRPGRGGTGLFLSPVGRPSPAPTYQIIVNNPT